MNTKRNYILLLVTVLSLGMLLTGGTYAWLTFSPAIISGNNLNAATDCFVIDYSGDFSIMLGDVNMDNNISLADYNLVLGYAEGTRQLSNIELMLADINKDGVVNDIDAGLVREMVMTFGLTYFPDNSLFPSKTDKGGILGYVTMGINESCDVSGVGDIKLNIGSSTDNQYFMNSALKYSLYASDNTTLLGSGILTTYGDKKLNTNSIVLTKTPTTYFVYIWLDGTKADNNYLNLPFSAYLHANAIQTES